MLTPSVSAYLIYVPNQKVLFVRRGLGAGLYFTFLRTQRMQQSKVASLRTPIIRYLLIEKSLVTAKGPGRSLPSAQHERAEIVQINLSSFPL